MSARRGGSGRTFGRGQRDRAQLIKLVHIAKAQLGLDEETYRAMLLREGGAASCAVMAAPALEKVLAYLQQAGFKPTGKGVHAGRPNTTDGRPLLRKVEALLADRKLPWAYAAAIAKRQCGREKLEFCTDHDLVALVNALVAAAKRADDTPPAAE